MSNADQETLRTVSALADRAYPHGFVTAVESDLAPKGLSEDTIRFISAKKNNRRGCSTGV